MSTPSADRHLSQISTMWTLLREAHQGDRDEIAEAQEALLERYSGSIYRYLLGALRDANAADEVFQEFALRFVRGDFRRADPERGQFRRFLKTALFNLVYDFQKRRRRHQGVDVELIQPAAPESEPDHDAAFTKSCMEDYLDRAWRALGQVQAETGQPYADVLRLRVDHPDLKSPELAAKLGQKTGKAYSAEATRQLLHRSRHRFAELLCHEVQLTLGSTAPDALANELMELGLYSYCKPILEKS